MRCTRLAAELSHAQHAASDLGASVVRPFPVAYPAKTNSDHLSQGKLPKRFPPCFADLLTGQLFNNIQVVRPQEVSYHLGCYQVARYVCGHLTRLRLQRLS